MKELDFTDIKWLKKFLSVGNDRWYVKNCTDICTLTRMVVRSTRSTLACFGLALGGLLATFLFLICPLFYLSVLLPDGWQVGSSDLMGFGFLCLLFDIFLLLMIAKCLHNIDHPVFPQWMVDIKQKHFPPSQKEDKPVKEKRPNKVVMLVKECYKSFKEKTCVKVKL